MKISFAKALNPKPEDRLQAIQFHAGHGILVKCGSDERENRS
jgi:hypothetical protein